MSRTGWSTICMSDWLLDCTPIFASDGLNHSFYALTAHFGQRIVGVGRRAHQWQIAAALLYGQDVLISVSRGGGEATLCGQHRPARERCMGAGYNVH
jgi:hypothetical protein